MEVAEASGTGAWRPHRQMAHDQCLASCRDMGATEAQRVHMSSSAHAMASLSFYCSKPVRASDRGSAARHTPTNAHIRTRARVHERIDSVTPTETHTHICTHACVHKCTDRYHTPLPRSTPMRRGKTCHTAECAMPVVLLHSRRQPSFDTGGMGCSTCADFRYRPGFT